MSEAVRQWISEQQVLVEVSGRKPESLRMVGPDDQIWQQWPIDAENLADQVERISNALGEQLPTGKHRGMLLVIDSRGEQYSAFPIVFHGRNTAASSAAQEARTLQQSTSIAIANLEQVIEIQRNEIARLGQALETSRENEAELVEALNEYRTQNLEVDLMMREYEERKATRDSFAQMAAPVLMSLSSTITPIVARKIKEKMENAAKKPSKDSAPGAGTSQSDNGSVVHDPVQSPGAETTSPANRSNGDSRGAKTPRRKKGNVNNGTTSH